MTKWYFSQQDFNMMYNANQASLVAQTVKNPPAVCETWVRSLSWEDPLEEGMTTHCSILAWRIPMDKGAWWDTVHGVKESDTTERLYFQFSVSCIGEGHGNPLQCSCLENPRDGGAWWAAVYGVTQSWTRLKRLSSSSSRGKWDHCWTEYRNLYQE